MTISPTSDTPVISVVICTYNHAALLANTLQALADQVEAPPFEVIVVDDGSEPQHDTGGFGILHPESRQLQLQRERQKAL